MESDQYGERKGPHPGKKEPPFTRSVANHGYRTDGYGRGCGCGCDDSSFQLQLASDILLLEIDQSFYRFRISSHDHPSLTRFLSELPRFVHRARVQSTSSSLLLHSLNV